MNTGSRCRAARSTEKVWGGRLASTIVLASMAPDAAGAAGSPSSSSKSLELTPATIATATRSSSRRPAELRIIMCPRRAHEQDD
jgi:hypothetical protein